MVPAEEACLVKNSSTIMVRGEFAFRFHHQALVSPQQKPFSPAGLNAQVAIGLQRGLGSPPPSLPQVFPEEDSGLTIIGSPQKFPPLVAVDSAPMIAPSCRACLSVLFPPYKP